MTHRTSLIIATKDRPDDLGRLLDSLRCQSRPPVEIVVVDGGSNSIEPVLSEFPELTIQYLRHWPPSAAAQRNAGIRSCDCNSTLIGFADDDTIFEPQAFERMLEFWEKTTPDVLGASFNIRNYPVRGNGFLKRSALAQRLGLYSPELGSVSLSGWQTVVGEVADTKFVQWLPSTASVFRRSVLSGDAFDEFFESYSYLEDLDFSYTKSRAGRLAIVADAGYFHYPSPHGRISLRLFGKYEVRNRLYFVQKHRLSLIRCYLGLAIRFGMSVATGIARIDLRMLTRALGNLEELVHPTMSPRARLADQSQHQ